MTALAIALAYLGTLGFVGYLLRRRDRYRSDVSDVVAASVRRLNALELGAEKWSHAAQWVEARELERGLKRV